jgi:hypothetical protein
MEKECIMLKVRGKLHVTENVTIITSDYDPPQLEVITSTLHLQNIIFSKAMVLIEIQERWNMIESVKGFPIMGLK